MKSIYSSGFTIVELLVTISVVGILLALGVPSFHTTILNNRMSARVNEMVAEFSFARSEAVKRGSSVTICKRNNAGNACSNAAGFEWKSGWIVFSDVDGDRMVDAGTDTILRVHGEMVGLSSLRIIYNAITFNASGFAAGINNNTMTFCDRRGLSQAKGLVLAKTGRLRSAISTDTLVCP